MSEDKDSVKETKKTPLERMLERPPTIYARNQDWHEGKIKREIKDQIIARENKKNK